MDSILPPLDYTLSLLTVALVVFVVSFIIYFIRLLRESRVSDLVLVINALTFNSVVIIVVLSVILRSPYIMVAPILLLIWIYLFNLVIVKNLRRLV